MSYNFFDHLYSAYSRPTVYGYRDPNLYPSEASVKLKDGTVLGKCAREIVYRLIGAEKGPASNSLVSYALLGKALENEILEKTKELGVWVGNAIRFMDPILHISGELDFVLRNPENGEVYGAEMKTFSGYQATKLIMGSSKEKGQPKPQHLLQTLTYLMVSRRGYLLTPNGRPFPYFKLLYQSRDSGDRKEFNIALVDTADGTIRYSIDGEIQTDFTINELENRYYNLVEMANKALTAQIPIDALPDREFKLKYSSQEIEHLYQIKKIPKTKYEAYKTKGTPIGDYQCSYCAYKNSCWPRNTRTDTSEPEPIELDPAFI